ncbi:uncharacterized protein LOC132554693 [Ylistrum balloti]|uniref:uncharacterized protein LOC132554693 n=1 Tax=Ylistrum balloti TaxID=509963 RepID=UPI002905D4DB|nr:uncharacterized protein LOC132554693 [Ylistrum balloti]
MEKRNEGKNPTLKAQIEIKQYYQMLHAKGSTSYKEYKQFEEGMDLTGRDLYRRHLRLVKTDKLLQSSLKWYDNLGLFDDIRNGQQTVKIQKFARDTRLKQNYVSAIVQSLIVSHVFEPGCYGELDIPGNYAEDLINTIDECAIAPEHEDVVGNMYACARIDGEEGYTPDERSLVWRALVLDGALKLIKDTIDQSERGLRTLMDISCGQGDVSIRLAKEFPATAVNGCDMSPSNIQRCNEKSDGVENISFSTVTNVIKLPANWNRTYDVVTLLQADPHDKTNTKDMILEAVRILQDDGFLIYIEPEVGYNPRDNRFPESAYDHAISFWYRLPTGQVGVPESEYQVDNTENFLSDCGLRVEGHHLIHCSLRNHAFVCVKRR